MSESKRFSQGWWKEKKSQEINKIKGQDVSWKNLASRLVIDRLEKRKDINSEDSNEKEINPEFERKFGQWTIKVNKDGYEFFNLEDSGKKRFYSLENGDFGQPLIIAEPDNAFEVPSGVTYANAKGEEIDKPAEKISGVICQDKDGSVVHRFSLSNPKAPRFEKTDNGIIIFVDDDGEEKQEEWFLNTLFDKDGQRIQNHDGYYSKVKPESVRVSELQDVDFVELNSDFVDKEKSEINVKSISTLAKKMYTKLTIKLGRKEQVKEKKPDFEYKVNQWTIRVWQDRYEIVNLADDGTQKFYKIISGDYGQPLIIAEPDNAFEVPSEVTYANANGEEIDQLAEKISGVICQNTDGSVAHRFSLSNPNAPKFKKTKDGIII